MTGIKRSYAREGEENPPAKKSRTAGVAPRTSVLSRCTTRDVHTQQHPEHKLFPQSGFEAAEIRRLARHGGLDLSSLRGV